MVARTIRRVNALEHHLLPQLRSDHDYVQQRLVEEPTVVVTLLAGSDDVSHAVLPLDGTRTLRADVRLTAHTHGT
ncbi:MAG: V-type ATP synthase subunit D [Halobaculum sp.]